MLHTALGLPVFGEEDPTTSQEIIFRVYALKNEPVPDALRIFGEILFNPDGTFTDSAREQMLQVPTLRQELLKVALDPGRYSAERILGFNAEEIIPFSIFSEKQQEFQPFQPKRGDVFIYVGESPDGHIMYEADKLISDISELQDFVSLCVEMQSDSTPSKVIYNERIIRPFSEHHARLNERLKSGKLEKYLVLDETGKPKELVVKVTERPQAMLERLIESYKSSQQFDPESQPATSQLSYPVSQPANYPESQQTISYESATQPSSKSGISLENQLSTQPVALVQTSPNTAYRSSGNYIIPAIALLGLCVIAGALTLRKRKSKKSSITLD